MNTNCGVNCWNWMTMPFPKRFNACGCGHVFGRKVKEMHPGTLWAFSRVNFYGPSFSIIWANYSDQTVGWSPQILQNWLNSDLGIIGKKAQNHDKSESCWSRISRQVSAVCKLGPWNLKPLKSHKKWLGRLKIFSLCGVSFFGPYFHDFAHIPWKDTPNFTKPPKRKKFLHKLLVKCPGYLPGVCGWDLRQFFSEANLLSCGRLLKREDKNVDHQIPEKKNGRFKWQLEMRVFSNSPSLKSPR